MVEAANSGASVLCLCEKGDAMIMEETGKIFKKEKEMKKGEACSKDTLGVDVFLGPVGWLVCVGKSTERATLCSLV